MVGAVLTQNTAWTNVEKAIANLKSAKALSPQAIAAAPHRRLAAWLKPSGYFNVKAQRLRAFCQWLIRNGGVKRIARLPTEVLRTELLQVHGVGPETADDILLYAFNRPVFVIDAYTRRLFQRLGLIQADEAYETLRGLFEKSLATDAQLFNEYHALIVVHAKDVCRPRPRCAACKLGPLCPSRELSKTIGRR
jgi:endonuclease-3 related protein